MREGIGRAPGRCSPPEYVLWPFPLLFSLQSLPMFLDLDKGNHEKKDLRSRGLLANGNRTEASPAKRRHTQTSLLCGITRRGGRGRLGTASIILQVETGKLRPGLGAHEFNPCTQKEVSLVYAASSRKTKSLAFPKLVVSFCQLDTI